MRFDPQGNFTAVMQPPAAKAERRPWLALVNAVMALADGRGELLRHAERPWASATFSGTRHTVALRFAGNDATAAGERLIALLPDHEFALPGQIVVDAALASADHQLLPDPRLDVELELLLLEEDQ